MKDNDYGWILKQLDKCTRFNDIPFAEYANLKRGTVLYAVHGMENGMGLHCYTLKSYKLISYDNQKCILELDDMKGNYAGFFPIGKNGNPIYTSNKYTNKQDTMERTFTDYMLAFQYLSVVRDVCDLIEEWKRMIIYKCIISKEYNVNRS